VILSTLFSLILTAQVPLPAFNPTLDWETIETEHFLIHYDSQISEGAERLSQRVEPIYRKLTANFQWEPSSKTHLVLCDFTDDSNGLSTPLPYNTIYLYAAPPTDGSALDYYDDWLKTLITHEFTHTVHLDMARGINKIPRATLGRVWIPNGLEQQWAIEGLAMFEETHETTKGRGRSPYIKMFLRAASKENKFMNIDRATYWNDQYPYGSAAYWYGIGFHEYLAQKFGAQKIFDFANANSKSLLPGMFNFKTDKIFGKSFSRLWAEWREEEKKNWEDLRKQTSSQFEAKDTSLPLVEKTQLLAAPVFNDQGNELYYLTIERNKPSLYLSKWKTENSSEKPETTRLADGFFANRLSYSEGNLYYSKLSEAPTQVSLYAVYYDLWSFNLATKKEQQLTAGLRLRDAIVSHGSVIGVRVNHFKSELVRFPLPKDENEKVQMEVLYRAKGFDAISKPNLSPDGKTIVFSMKVENANRDLYLLNTETKEVSKLTDDTFEDHDPQFSKSGNEIYFSSVRPLTPSNVTVPNLFSVDLTNRNVSRLTDALTGISWPNFSKDRVAFGYFRASGFEARVLNISDLVPVAESSTSRSETETNSEFTNIPKEEKTPHSEPRSYSVGNTMLPHYLLPFFFYTESDVAIGALTGSHDPLNFHSWNASAYYLSAPNRPAGSLVYTYRGLPIVDLYAGGYASIADYGKILVDNASNVYSYYERDYGGYLGYGLPLYWNHRPSNFAFAQSVFIEKRMSLLKWPANVYRGRGSASFSNGLSVADLAFSPEQGTQWGVSSLLSWASPPTQSIEGFSPTGSAAKIMVDYSPKGLGSEFKLLATTLTAKTYQEIAFRHSVAFETALGLQWLDPLYQRSYRLGGSLGEGPLSSVSRRTYPLRGIEASYFKGEGLIQGSLEYRYLLTKSLPGFGTAPIWFKNLHSAIFADGGQTFDWKTSPTLIQPITKKFSLDQFTATTGLELRSDVSVAYAPPLTFRLGFGYVLFLEGENVASQKVNQAYFQIGSSF
jgi:hypothetical protein